LLPFLFAGTIAPQLRAPLKIQSSPKCKARKKFRSAAYGLYASKKFFPQRSITSHLVAVLWQRSGMAITNDLPSVFCWVSQMASGHFSSSISWDTTKVAVKANLQVMPELKSGFLLG
jgi:hypothetical protein